MNVSKFIALLIAAIVFIDGLLLKVSAKLKVTPESARPTRHAFPVPRQSFSETLAEQAREWGTNALVFRFAASRKKPASDRFQTACHFVSPEDMLIVPNGP